MTRLSLSFGNSKISIDLKNLELIEDHIEDDIGSQTRFVILSDFKNEKSTDDKTSILVKFPDRQGVLVQFLTDFNDAGINFAGKSEPIGIMVLEIDCSLSHTLLPM